MRKNVPLVSLPAWVSLLLAPLACGLPLLAQGNAVGAGKTMIVVLSDEDQYMVDQVQADFIVDTLDRAEREGYERVVIQLETNGGIVFAARKITERLLRMKIPTVAYVKDRAFSAGVFIAWACDEIVMEEHSTLGDAQMIIMTDDGMQEAPEKLVSVYRSDWKKSSELKGRSYALAQGFFDVKAEVLQVGNAFSWEFILRADYDALPADKQKPIMKTIVPDTQLLTMSSQEAERAGIAQIVQDLDTYLTNIHVPAQQRQTVTMSFNLRLLRFLGLNNWIFSLLVLVGLIGIYMEIKVPGFGAPGLAAVVCFTLVFGSRYFIGTASVFEMAIFAVGLLLCLAEIFVLPGFGIAGILGLCCIFGSLILASMPSFDLLPDSGLKYQWLGNLSMWMVISFIGSLVAVFLLFPVMLNLPVTRRNTLPTELRAEDGYVMDTVSAEKNLLGLTGVARGDLRPSGKVLLDDGRFLDVVSDGRFVEDGSRIRVARIDGNRIIVAHVHGV